jgi:GNAT superfamily N-acetyltransferase
VAVAVRDDQQNLGVGTEILSYLKQIARRRGLLGFTARVGQENAPMLHLFEKMGLDTRSKATQGVYLLDMHFKA